MASEKITIGLTNDCNLRCSYCFQECIRSKDKATLSDILDYIDDFFLNSKKLKTIHLYGGEPFLEIESIISILSHINEKNYQVSQYLITTNGTLCNEKNMSLLKKANKGRIDNILLRISIDGTKVSHDNNRKFRISGKGSWDAIVKNIRKLVLDGWNIMFNAVFDLDANRKFMDDLMYLESLHPKDITIGIVWKNFQPEKKDMLETFFNDLSEHYVYLVKNRINPPYHEITGQIKAYSNNDVFDKGRCEAFRGEVFIDPEGNIYPCHLFAAGKNLVIGTKTKLDKKKQDFFMRYGIQTNKSNKICQKCEINHFCPGPCAANSYALYKDMNHPDPVQCIINKLQYNTAKKIFEILNDDSFFKGIIG